MNSIGSGTKVWLIIDDTVIAEVNVTSSNGYMDTQLTSVKDDYDLTISTSYYDYGKYTDDYINYWHAIELREYWHQPRVIGKPIQPKLKPIMGFVRNKLHKHKLKPEICLN